MDGDQPTPSFEQFSPLLMIDSEIAGQTLVGFLNVGTGLIKSKRKAVHDTHDVDR
jgi:hypothetical protein